MASNSNKQNKKKQEIVERQILKNLPSESYSWIAQPLSFTLMRADFSKPMLDVTVEFWSEIQGSLFEIYRKRLQEPELGLYEDSSELPPIRVYLNQLGVLPQNYVEVEKAAHELFNQSVYTYVNIDGQYSIKQVHMFSSVTVPYTEKDANNDKSFRRRKGFIEFKVNNDAVPYIFNLAKGYNQYIKEVTRKCKRPTTIRIYMMMTAYRHRKEWTVNYEDLHAMMGFDEYNETKKEWIPIKCKSYNDFKKRILNAAMDDLKELAETNSVDCYFDYEEILPRGQKRGTPQKIKFIIYTTDLGMEHDRNSNGNRNKYKIQSLLNHYFKMNSQQCKDLIMLLRDEDMEAFNEKIMDVNGYIEAHREQIADKRAYAYKSLLTWITDTFPSADAGDYEEVVESDGSLNAISPDINVSDDMRERWTKFQSLIYSRIGEEEYDMFFRHTKFISYKNNELTLQPQEESVMMGIEENYIPLLQEAITMFFGRTTNLRYDCPWGEEENI